MRQIWEVRSEVFPSFKILHSSWAIRVITISLTRAIQPRKFRTDPTAKRIYWVRWSSKRMHRQSLWNKKAFPGRPADSPPNRNWKRWARNRCQRGCTIRFARRTIIGPGYQGWSSSEMILRLVLRKLLERYNARFITSTLLGIWVSITIAKCSQEESCTVGNPFLEGACTRRYLMCNTGTGPLSQSKAVLWPQNWHLLLVRWRWRSKTIDMVGTLMSSIENARAICLSFKIPSF